MPSATLKIAPLTQFMNWIILQSGHNTMQVILAYSSKIAQVLCAEYITQFGICAQK